MKLRFILTCIVTICLATACGEKRGHLNKNLAEQASGDMLSYQNSYVNSIEQARPTIMVIPGDHTLSNFKSLSTSQENGVSYVIRDYQKYILDDEIGKTLTTYIQDKFVAQNYPLDDFEQSLKSISSRDASDLADGIALDSKTMLLRTTHPDIILEMEYSTSFNKRELNSHDYSSKKDGKVSLMLRAIDAYTNKVVATVNCENSKGNTVLAAVQNKLDAALPGFMTDITDYFSEILTKGREVTVTINVDKGSNVSLDDESIEGDTYSDWIVDYIKAHTIKGAYKMQNNTSKELSFTNVRIQLLQEDGTQYSVYDWTRDLQKNLRTNLGVQCINRSQGLGEVVLTLKKL